jgi:hypothetical protein
VAHVRLCYSRMLFVRAYPREPALAKAGVENPVGVVRERFFTPRLRVASSPVLGPREARTRGRS